MGSWMLQAGNRILENIIVYTCLFCGLTSQSTIFQPYRHLKYEVEHDGIEFSIVLGEVEGVLGRRRLEIENMDCS